MKKILVTIFCVALLSAYLWANRVDVFVWLAPRIQSYTKPVADNIPIKWQKGPDSETSLPTDRPPNIILVLADDLGFNDISFYNGGAADGGLQTPNIDRIAQQGVAFSNGYAANAMCAPSRASLLTGRYSTRFGFEYTPIFKLGPTIFQWMEDINPGPLSLMVDREKAKSLPPIDQLGMPTEEVTIAEVLKQQNYYTAHIGKWHVGGKEGMRAIDQGFDDSLSLKGGLYLPEDDESVINAKVEGDGVDRMLWAAGRYAVNFNGGSDFQPNGYLTDYFTEEAVKVITENKHQPFFLYLAHWGVHNPLQAYKTDYDALSHIKDHRLRVYASMIRALDRSLKRIDDALLENDLYENTLIVFTSDNGGASYIGLPDINKPYRGWKLTHFEGGTHVPFMARWPAKISMGSEFSPPIHHFDLFQTFAAIAKADLPNDRKLDGVNLMPYINNKRTEYPHETLFWRQGHQQTVLHKGWKLIRAGQPEKKQSAGHKKFLFDLNADPLEQTNLALKLPKKVRLLERLLEKHNAEQAAPLWPSVLQSPQLIDKTAGEAYEDGDAYLYWPN